MESKQRILLTLGICIGLIFLFFFITEAITKHTGFSISETKENDFDKCLKEQDIHIYINTNEVSTTLKKMQLFDSLQDFEITNCMINNQECLENGINSFPTWIINGEKINKDISISELTEYSGCELITNN